jgi:hypothetical protein
MSLHFLVRRDVPWEPRLGPPRIGTDSRALLLLALELMVGVRGAGLVRVPAGAVVTRDLGA